MYLRRRIRVKRYIVDGNVTDTRHVVGFASERLFVDYTDHAALLCAVANEVRGMEHGEDCPAVAACKECGGHPDEIRHNPRARTTLGIEVHDFIPGECNCPRGKVLAMLEVA